MKEKEYLTQEKYDALRSELDHLKTVRRKEVADALEYAKSLGDLSENAEYQEARDIQATIEDRISKLEAILSSAVIMPQEHVRADKVDIGSRVVVRKDSDNEEYTYTIVGSEEASMQQGKLSYRAPLGAALIGKAKGETFSFNTPNGQKKYTVMSVE